MLGYSLPRLCRLYDTDIARRLVTACAKARKLPPPGWTVPASSVESVFSPTGADLGKSKARLSASLLRPTDVYETSARPTPLAHPSRSTPYTRTASARTASRHLRTTIASLPGCMASLLKLPITTSMRGIMAGQPRRRS